MISSGFLAQGIEWLWRASWQASVLVLLVLAVQALSRTRLAPPWRFALWWLVLVRLMLPIAPESTWSVFNLAKAEKWHSPANTISASGVKPRDESRPDSTPVIANPYLPSLAEKLKPSKDLAPAVTLNLPKPSPLPTQPVKRSSKEFWYSALVCVWLAGVIFYAGQLFLGTSLLLRRLRGKSPQRDPKILEVLEECRQAIGLAHVPAVIVTEAVDSPALFGVWHCRLLVPMGMQESFSLDEWRHVFLHELAHLRRRDTQINGLMTLIQGIHWFNPVVWLAMARMRTDRELACDAAALACAREGEARAYGHTILKLLDGLGHPTMVPGLVGILEDKRQIKQRIRHIAGFKKTRRWPVLAALALAGLCVFAMTDAPKQMSPKSAKETKSIQLTQNYKATLAKELEASRGRVPSEDMKAKMPEFKAEQINVGTMVEDGIILYQAAKLNEAEKKFVQALNIDPNNTPANYYLSLVKEAKFKMEAARRTMTEKDKMVKKEETWNPPTQGKLLPDANPFATTNRIYTGPGRQLLLNKLERIILDQYPTNPTETNVPLSVVLEELTELSRARDPDHEGVNFLISSHLDRPTMMFQQEFANQATNQQATLGPQGGKAIDPAAGLPTSASTNTTAVLVKDLRNEVMVRIKPTLRNVRLRDVLDAIIKVAEAPGTPDFAGIQYSVEEYAIIFSQRVPEAEQLHNRLFKVDPNSFIQGLESIEAIQPSMPSNTNNQNDAAREGQTNGLLSAYSGYKLPAETQPTKNRTIQDYVRQFFSVATGINFGGPSTNVFGKDDIGGPAGFIGGQSGHSGLKEQEVRKNGQTPIRPMFFNDRTGILFVRATLKELDTLDLAIQMLNQPPAQIMCEVKLLAIDSANPAAMEVLSQADFDVSKKMAVKSNEELFHTSNAPSLMPGILTGAQYREFLQSLAAAGGCELISSPNVTTLSARQCQFNIEKAPFELLVLPIVNPDGYSMNINVDFTLMSKTFLGAKENNRPEINLSAWVGVRDGQTLIFRGLEEKEEATSPKKNKIVYVICLTPTIIDPAGNRVHAQEQPDDPGEILPLPPASKISK